ncbi:hypothetical protein OR571_22565, partial [Psychrobacillus sp. NEAU-3TGS]|nr:hypothetical protein [Psychrobacillus sp. NEAU-3TGS]
MEKTIECVLDNLVIYVESVRLDVFEAFREKLGVAEVEGTVPPIRLTIGQGYSDYHYRLNVGQGGGAITIGFKHNSVRSNEICYTMRVE